MNRSFSSQYLVVISAILLLACAADAHASTLGRAGNTSSAAASTRCYVGAYASGANDGSTWADAYTDLQSALHNPTCGIIWVTAGVYKPVVPANPSSVTDAERAMSFSIGADVAVYGGFVGGETALSQRNITDNVTILSGDIDGNDTNADGNQVDETSDDIIGANTAHVVVIDGNASAVDASTIVDGFTITAGDDSDDADGGGGLWCKASGTSAHCSPALSHLVMTGNTAFIGGAMKVDGSHGASSAPTMADVIFSGNSAYGGAGMYNDASAGGTASPVLTSVTFSGNHADARGGGMFDSGYGGISSPILADVTFSDNDAGSNGGAMYNNGNGGSSNPTLTNVTFSGNSADYHGGAMYNQDTGGASNPVLTNVISWGDSAAQGGAELYDATGAASSINHSVIAGGCPAGARCTDVIDADPQLGPLHDNGGFTATMKPGLAGSAVDAGAGGSDCPLTDQRGVTRPQGAACDIGAVEVSVCRVDASAAAGGDGASWATAYDNLRDALSDTTCDEIWVAADVYKPVVPANASSVTDAERAMSFNIRPDVGVYGGFAGGETALAQRKPKAHPTILSGDIDANDVDADGNGIDETYSQIVGANSYHVIVMDGRQGTPITASTVLDGFVITAGATAGAHSSLSDGCGGGLYCNGSDGGVCSPELRNLVFSGNGVKEYGVYGGAIYNDGYHGASSPSLGNVTFVGNAAQDGGAMYNSGSYGNSSPLLDNVTFLHNAANDEDGGAMYNDGIDGISSPTLTNVTFSGNTAIYGSGAAMYSQNQGGTSSPNLTNVIAWDNLGKHGVEIYGATPTINASVVRGGCPSGASCTDVINADPLLGPLQDNGGFTPTLLPGAGGSAIDAGDDGHCSLTDQRGAHRPQGTACDIGAVERALTTTWRALGENNQHALAGDLFRWPLVVQALDASGHGVGGLSPHVDVPGSSASALCNPSASALCNPSATDVNGIARILCVANGSVGSYPVKVRVLGSGGWMTTSFTLNNDTNDRIFGSGFEGTALPTAVTP